MTALNAPRALNALDSCNDSSFSDTVALATSDSHRDATSGVRRRYGAIRFRARSTSTRFIREIVRRAKATAG